MRERRGKLSYIAMSAAVVPVPHAGTPRTYTDCCRAHPLAAAALSAEFVRAAGARGLAAAVCEPLEQTGPRPAACFRADYDVSGMLGRGGFGYVERCTRRCDGRAFAVKHIPHTKVHAWIDHARLGRIPAEVAALASLRHPGILRFEAVFADEKEFLLVMELPPDSVDLFEYIETHEVMGDSPAAVHIFRHVVAAVSYCHGHGVAHRDIKDENVLINTRSLRTKLCDFGSVAPLVGDCGGRYRDFRGTVEYASPEQLENEAHYADAAEVWQLGVLLYTLVFAEAPFRTDKEARRARLPPLPRVIGPALDHLLRWMLQRDPQRRPSVHQILSHPWMNAF